MATPALAGLVKTIKAVSSAKGGEKLAVGAKEYMKYRSGDDSSTDSGSSGSSNSDLHPMAKAAMSLDSGFYGHPYAKGKKTVKNPSTSCAYKADTFTKSNIKRGKR